MATRKKTTEETEAKDYSKEAATHAALQILSENSAEMSDVLKRSVSPPELLKMAAIRCFDNGTVYGKYPNLVREARRRLNASGEF